MRDSLPPNANASSTLRTSSPVSRDNYPKMTAGCFYRRGRTTLCVVLSHHASIGTYLYSESSSISWHHLRSQRRYRCKVPSEFYPVGTAQSHSMSSSMHQIKTRQPPTPWDLVYLGGRQLNRRLSKERHVFRTSAIRARALSTPQAMSNHLDLFKPSSRHIPSPSYKSCVSTMSSPPCAPDCVHPFTTPLGVRSFLGMSSKSCTSAVSSPP